MKGEDLFDALGKIDDRLIESAEDYNYKKVAFKWVVGIAACICLLITGSYVKRYS